MNLSGSQRPGPPCSAVNSCCQTSGLGGIHEQAKDPMMRLSQIDDSFLSAWRERLKALTNLPPGLKIVWEAGPRVVASGIACRTSGSRWRYRERRPTLRDR